MSWLLGSYTVFIYRKGFTMHKSTNSCLTTNRMYETEFTLTLEVPEFQNY